MTSLDPDQCEPAEITKIRIFHNHEGDGCDWNVDGADDKGRYTEACARFSSKDEALDAVSEFIGGLGLSGSYPIEVSEPLTTQERLEQLRGAIRAERISYGEIAELEYLAPYIDPDDTELLEWAGVPEFGPEREAHRTAFRRRSASDPNNKDQA